MFTELVSFQMCLVIPYRLWCLALTFKPLINIFKDSKHHLKISFRPFQPWGHTDQSDLPPMFASFCV